MCENTTFESITKTIEKSMLKNFEMYCVLSPKDIKMVNRTVAIFIKCMQDTLSGYVKKLQVQRGRARIAGNKFEELLACCRKSIMENYTIDDNGKILNISEKQLSEISETIDVFMDLVQDHLRPFVQKLEAAASFP